MVPCQTLLGDPHTFGATHFSNEQLFLTSMMLILTTDKVFDVH